MSESEHEQPEHPPNHPTNPTTFHRDANGHRLGLGVHREGQGAHGARRHHLDGEGRGGGRLGVAVVDVQPLVRREDADEALVAARGVAELKVRGHRRPGPRAVHLVVQPRVALAGERVGAGRRGLCVSGHGSTRVRRKGMEEGRPTTHDAQAADPQHTQTLTLRSPSWLQK